MTVKSFRPYTPSRRTITVADFSEITRVTPEKSLTKGLRKHGGRNNTGMVMVRHHGGGHKRSYRTIDFKRDKFGIPARVATKAAAFLFLIAFGIANKTAGKAQINTAQSVSP